MSRVGKNPISVPSGVTVTVDGRTVTAKGKLGELHARLTDDVNIAHEGDSVVVTPRSSGKAGRMMWGTARAVIQNLVTGVETGFTKKLEIQGVGYRAQLQGKTLVLQLGFSRDVHYQVPDGIKIECPDLTHITVSGADKQRVGQVAAEIRDFRSVEPYKGKGIRYEGEFVMLKEGKKK